MNLFGRNLKKDIAIIAEAGVNHEGNISTAIKMIDFASEAGADAIKFQIYNPERFVSRDNKNRFKRTKKFSLKDEDYKILKKRALKRKIGIIATPVTDDKLNLACSLGPAVKIASGDINFTPLLHKIAKKKKKIIISTGNSNIKEISKTYNYLKKENPNIDNKLIFLHCVSSYPTPISQSNIKRIEILKKRFKKLIVGYSNHCLEKEAILAACALGAKVVEVHITLSKKNKKFRDHQMSFDRTQFSDLVKSIRAINLTLSEQSYNTMKCERSEKKLMRKGLIAKNNLTKNKILNKNDVDFARPASYFSFLDKKKIIGKKIKKNIPKGYLLKKHYFF